jgi:hypothetical protein
MEGGGCVQFHNSPDTPTKHRFQPRQIVAGLAISLFGLITINAGTPDLA